jgi:hypothetical protein
VTAWPLLPVYWVALSLLASWGWSWARRLGWTGPTVRIDPDHPYKRAVEAAIEYRQLADISDRWERQQSCK